MEAFWRNSKNTFLDVRYLHWRKLRTAEPALLQCVSLILPILLIGALSVFARPCSYVAHVASPSCRCWPDISHRSLSPICMHSYTDT